MKMINIVIDSSGSMQEDDKNAVIKYLLSSINNAKYMGDLKNIRFDFFCLGTNTFKMKEETKIKFSGDINLENISKLKDIINMEYSTILISDGNLDTKVKEEIKKIFKNLFCIYIGIDANLNILKYISSTNKVYSVIDIFQLLDDIK